MGASEQTRQGLKPPPSCNSRAIFRQFSSVLLGALRSPGSFAVLSACNSRIDSCRHSKVSELEKPEYVMMRDECPQFLYGKWGAFICNLHHVPAVASPVVRESIPFYHALNL